MERIKFANGEVHDCSYVGTIQDGNSNIAMIALTDVGFLEAATIFSDPEKTARMETDLFVYLDYTELKGIGVLPHGIQATLKGGHDERRS